MSDDVETPTEEAADPVLSDAEVDALLTGVHEGMIEVHASSGPRYADVRPYEVPQRARLVSNSLPMLDLLNTKLAERLRRQTQFVVGAEVIINPVQARRCRFGDALEFFSGDVSAIQFSAAPLPGTAALLMKPRLVSRLVELFFGGAANSAGGHEKGAVSQGMQRVIDSYSLLTLDVLKATWEKLQAITPAVEKTESSLSLLNIADDGDPIVRTDFEYDFGTYTSTLSLLFPEQMLASHIAAFEGSQRVEDPIQNARWADAIRDRLPRVSVDLSSTVGRATMTLGQLICLEPGDVVPIESPTDAVLQANNVELIAGRFGVHNGVNAFAAKHWIDPDEPAPGSVGIKDGTHG